MVRTFVATSLLLAAMIGCSRTMPPTSAQHETAKPKLETVSTAAPEPAPAITAAPAKAAAAKPVVHKDSKAATSAEAPIEKLAKCLTAKGAVMYGVFWCSHCQDQKKEFGDAFKYVHYVECVKPDDPRTLLPECKAQGITHTPTWIFGDGSRVEGAQPLATLAQKTGCKAP